MLTTKKIIKRFHPTLERGGLSRQVIVKNANDKNVPKKNKKQKQLNLK